MSKYDKFRIGDIVTTHVTKLTLFSGANGVCVDSFLSEDECGVMFSGSLGLVLDTLLIVPASTRNVEPSHKVKVVSAAATGWTWADYLDTLGEAPEWLR